MESNHDHSVNLVGYARSLDQSDDGENALLEQILKLRNAGARMIICDVALGPDDELHGFLNLLNLAKEGLVQEVVVTRWDRLMRTSDRYIELRSIFEKADIKIRLLESNDVYSFFESPALSNFFQASSEKQNCQL